MELETQPIDKENKALSNEEKMILKLGSRESSSKETFQEAEEGNEDSVSQNFIGSDEKVNPQQKEIINEKDHRINQNANDSEYDKKQSSKTNNKDSLQPTDKENDSDKKDNLVNPQQRNII